MELPPAHGALVDSLNVVFSGAAHNLSKAHWATVKRDEYMRIVRERKQQCATYSEASIREDVAPTRLPEDGVPDHIQACLQPVDGAAKAPERLLGPGHAAAIHGSPRTPRRAHCVDSVDLLQNPLMKRYKGTTVIGFWHMEANPVRQYSDSGTWKRILCDSIRILAHGNESCATVLGFWHMGANPVRKY